MYKKTKENILQGLLLDLYRQGLGELLIMHRTENEVMLGNIVMNKGRLILKDLDLMKNVTPKSVGACWDLGIIGAICNLKNQEWESMSYLGVDHCKFKVDLSNTRRDLFVAVSSEHGDRLLDFKGSIYRGINLALNAELLPVVLLYPIKTIENKRGLAISDLKFASIPVDLIACLNDMVRSSVKRHLTSEMMDLDMSEEEFIKLFHRYLD
jgi:hypothetical protein